MHKYNINRYSYDMASFHGSYVAVEVRKLEYFNWWNLEDKNKEKMIYWQEKQKSHKQIQEVTTQYR